MRRWRLAFTNRCTRAQRETEDDPSWGTQTTASEPTSSYRVWWTYCQVRGHLANSILENYISLSHMLACLPPRPPPPPPLFCDPCIVMQASLSAFPSLSQNERERERECLETVAEGAILFLKKKLLKKCVCRDAKEE